MDRSEIDKISAFYLIHDWPAWQRGQSHLIGKRPCYNPSYNREIYGSMAGYWQVLVRPKEGGQGIMHYEGWDPEEASKIYNSL